MGPLDYAGTVFGIGDTDTLMPDTARRYARSLALHNRDRVLPPGQHDPLPDGAADPGSGLVGTHRRGTSTTPMSAKISADHRFL